MIVNLTQHLATPEQIEAGVIDLPPAEREALTALLTFDSLPTRQEIADRAADIAELAAYNGLGGDDADSPPAAAAMIGGAPYLMPALDAALRAVNITPLYAFSVRESVEQTQADGSVRKVNVFRHAGFV
jgi:hypothetical protein